MNFFKKFFFIIFLLVLYLNIYSIDYYICLGSFLDNNNAIEYSINLNKIGINTILEKAKIKKKYFTRVLLNTKFKSHKQAIMELKKLLNNEVIKKSNIKDLWVRSGKLSNIQNIDNSKLTYNKNNTESKGTLKKETVKIEKKTDKKNITTDENKKNENKIQSKTKLEKESEKEKNIENVSNVKEKNELEELDEDKEKITITIEKKQVENKYKIIDSKGYANCIFASQPIELGKESSYELKTEFSKPEEIYARCYLPESIGKIKVSDFWHEIWIDGKFIRKTVFNSPPDPSWDQIQIWISEEDYSDILNSLKKGKHKITIWVLKNELKKENDKSEITTVKLSKGEFTYIVP